MHDIESMRLDSGAAGQFKIVTVVRYANEPQRIVEFIGSVYGGPIVMVIGELKTYVSNPERYGRFNRWPFGWVEKFFDREEKVWGQWEAQLPSAEEVAGNPTGGSSS